MARKMKDSGIEWIGEIPEDWETIRVKNLFNVSRGRVISKLETTDEGKYPVYSSQTENDGIFGYIDTYDYSGEALTWTTDGEKAGTVFYRNGKYNCTNICGILQKKEDSIYKTDIKYLFYAIRMVAEENKRPDTNGHKIMSNEMEKLSIPMTNYDEQVKIGLTLDEKSSNIDNTLNLVKKEIETLENYKKSLITEAVTKGLDKNVPMKDSGIEWIGEIPKHWNSIKSKILFEIKDGTHDTPKTVEKNEILNTKPLITTKNIYKDTIDFDSANHISYEDFKQIYKRSNVEKYDLIMPMIGTIGSPVIVEIDRLFAIKNVALFKMGNDKYLSKYVYYQFHSSYIEQQMKLNSKGGVQLFISMEMISRLNMFTTNREEIISIVNYLDKKTKLIDQTISLKQKQLKTLEEYKKSLIYEYVTGKKEAHLGKF